MANYKNIEPYADFAHTAAQKGGVDNYLKQIAESNYDLGVMDEKSTEGLKAAAIVTAALAIWEGGKAIYRYAKKRYEKRRKETVQKAESARNTIVSGVKEAEAAGLVVEETSGVE